MILSLNCSRKGLLCYIHLRMLADKVHFLIHGLYALHVCSCIVGQLNLLATADALCTPVEVTHVYRASYLACNCVEACLPSSYRLACSFWCKRKMNHLAGFHLLDDAEDDVAASLSVNRYAAHLAEKPSERSPEEFSFHHAVRLSAH